MSYKLSKLCEKIEQRCKNNNISWIDDLVEKCKAEIKSVKHEISIILINLE